MRDVDVLNRIIARYSHSYSTRGFGIWQRAVAMRAAITGEFEKPLYRALRHRHNRHAQNLRRYLDVDTDLQVSRF